eukprot:gi/632959791/ref/XP_007895824.1/ PREDICTED: zona pellucida-binding protein 1-like [Callorhinchus milii]
MSMLGFEQGAIRKVKGFGNRVRESRDKMTEDLATNHRMNRVKKKALDQKWKNRGQVAVFFHIYAVGQTLQCITKQLLSQSLVDPKYQWIGPKGKITKDSQRFIFTENGNLVFDTVYVVDSGNYTCNLTYVINRRAITTMVRYTVYVYHNPKKSVRLSADFYTTKCYSKEITEFEEHLQKQLEYAVQDFQCEVHHWNSACHSITASKIPLTYMFNFQFIVFPFALGWADKCNNTQCEQQSDNRVKKCFHLHLAGQISVIIHNVNNSLITVSKRINVYLYFLIVLFLLKVACPPGHYSARQDTICTPCAFGSFNKNYGRTECKNCPRNEATNRSGATSEEECHWIIYPWILPVASSAGTCILLLILWAICRRYRKKSRKEKYIQVAESEPKEQDHRLANIIKNVDLLEQKSKLKPSKHFIRHNPKHRVGFSDDQCLGLTDTETETCITAGSPLSGDTMFHTEHETSSEGSRSPHSSRSSTPQNLAAILKHGR